MARVLVTGAADGLGRATADRLIAAGHEVFVHARSSARVATACGRGEAGAVAGDLASHAETVALAGEISALGPLDAIVHNAAVYDSHRLETSDGHFRMLAVNVLAPYLLTVLARRPARLVYLSSDMHLGSTPDLDDLEWARRAWNSARAYSESKLLVTTLALAVARLWPDVRSNAVDPGWVRTRMGGRGAPGDLVSGSETQVWLAAGEDGAADADGGYWHHLRRQAPASQASDATFQERVLRRLAGITGSALK